MNTTALPCSISYHGMRTRFYQKLLKAFAAIYRHPEL